jgi:hypothetical protein
MGMTPDMPMVSPVGMPMDMPMATTALTYEALADRLGVTVNTVKRMASRHRWRKTRDNHGRALVHVPDDYLAHRDALETAQRARQAAASGHTHSDADGDVNGHVHGDAHGHALLARLATLQAELADLARKLGAAESRADAADVLVAELRTDRDAAYAREIAERERHAAEVARLEGALVAEADAARSEADALRQDRDHWREMAVTAQRQADETLRQLTERRPGVIKRITAVLRRFG